MNISLKVLGALAVAGTGIYLYNRYNLPSFSVVEFDPTTKSGKFKVKGKVTDFSFEKPDNQIELPNGNTLVSELINGRTGKFVQFSLMRNGKILKILAQVPTPRTPAPNE